MRNFDLFSDYFAQRDNAFRRADGRFKLTIAFVGITAILLSSSPVFPATVFIGVMITIMFLKIPFRLIAERFTMPGAIVVVVLLVRLWQGDVEQGLLLGSRVFGAFSLLLLLGFITPAYDIFRSLRWFRISKDWLEIAMMSYRYIFVFLDEVSDIAMAQKVRLGFNGRRRSMSSFGILAGSVMVRALEQSERTHEAMVARGYKNELPLAPMPALKTSDILLTFLACLALGGFYFICERGVFS
jgi:cobalt/nickel transport system permease protein